MGVATQYRARRGKLPTITPRTVVDDRGEGKFVVGLASGGGWVVWEPMLENPHLLMAGATRKGKTTLLRHWGLLALGWPWDVDVLDFKGGGDYGVLRHNGATLHTDPKDILGVLRQATEDIRERNKKMLGMELTFTDPNGIERIRWPTAFGDVPQEIRDDLGWKPRLIIIDEAADVSTVKGERQGKGKGGPTGMTYLREATQKAASAGVFVVVAIHRPNAEMFEGYIKQNMQARVLFGTATDETEQMMFGGLLSEHPERLLPRPAGTGFASEVGGRDIVRFHSPLLESWRYLPLARPSGPDPDSAESGPVGPSSPHAPEAPVPPRADSLAPPPVVSLGASAQVLVPVGDYTLPSAPPEPTSVYARFVRAVRPVATGPFVRTYLRARALLCWFRPVVPGAQVRDEFLPLVCKHAAGWRCQACGAPGPVEADHTVALQFGGADELENMRSLCIRDNQGGCHGAKTRVENWVRRQRTGGRKRLALTGASGLIGGLRLLPAVVWVALTPFLVGLFFGGSTLLLVPLWITALVWINLATWIWPLAREWARGSALGRVFFKARQPGLDGRSSWDDERERTRTGLMGGLARMTSRSRMAGLNFRYGSIGLCALILAGHTFTSWPGWAWQAVGAVL